MQTLAILGVMSACALIAFAGLVRLVRQGQSGAALTIVSVLGGVFVLLLYAAGRPFGIDPVLAMGGAMLFVLPALLGAGAGALLGWMLRRRDDRRI